MQYNEDNLILKTDSYKYSHFNIFVDGMENAFYYVEPRGGAYEEIVPFGLQYYFKKYLTKPISQSDIDEAEHLCQLHGVPFNKDGWQYILDVHNGYLPLRIRAVPEGTPVPVKNVLMTVETTDPNCFWLPGVMETLLLKIWYPTTVASRSRFLHKKILAALEKSSDNPSAEIDFKLHSFGYRGVSSEESGGIAGAAELIHFKGTDTVAGLVFVNNYYGTDVCGYSIPATEHSVICSFGRDHELDAYKKFLRVYAKPGAIIACVSDTYDLWNCIEKFWCGELKQMVIESGATLVVRPDSGHPPTVVVRTLQMLDAGYGHIINSKGYKVLNNVRVIQGDGINDHSLQEVIDAVLSNGYSMTNLAFGCGAGMIQKLDRDTCMFAYKESSVRVNGEDLAVCKSPIDDPDKKSKAGRLDLIKMFNGQFATVVLMDGRIETPLISAMQVLYENGKLLMDDDFETIRARAKMENV
jgi:nicotinamide phosphoribosyltransferase